MVSPKLLGPPELYSKDDDEKSLTPSTQTTPSSPPTKGLTENSSPTFLSTVNPCLDFFFHIVPDTPPDSLIQRLELAWKHNPLTTLKLICHLRGVRGTGKSDKEGFYTSAFWLHNHHPKTLACNTKWFAEFGYLKDLPEILFRVLEGLDVRKRVKEEREKSQVYWEKGKRKDRQGSDCGPRRVPRGRGRKLMPRRRNSIPIAERMKEMKLEEEKKEMKEHLKVLTPRKKKTIAMWKQAVSMYTNDYKYRFLHDQISHVFAELLASDVKFFNSGKNGKISLASKWCPSLDSAYDRSTLLCESIAKRVFPRDSDPEYEGIEEAHYCYRVRDRLRKQVLVPLRQALELPEIYMSSNNWGSLPYNRVASVAMKTYKSFFFEHDGERFKEFLEKVERGEAKIAAGAVLSHEIVRSVDDEEEGEGSKVGELQWKRMVEDLSKKGTFKNCIAICDVSGSMDGIPMEVSVALGLLVSELSEDPWKGKLITFSEHPELHIVEGNSLVEKKRFVEGMDWGMNTDFQKVFDKILQVAVDGKLSEEQMIKRVFVFSDMEFDQASANDWETDYEAIQRKYKEKGYGSAVPEIAFWNLRDSKATPVLGTQKGVALVSGFSKNLLNLFLEGDGIINPEVIMEQAISGEEYQKLVVFD